MRTKLTKIAKTHHTSFVIVVSFALIVVVFVSGEAAYCGANPLAWSLTPVRVTAICTACALVAGRL